MVQFINVASRAQKLNQSIRLNGFTLVVFSAKPKSVYLVCKDCKIWHRYMVPFLYRFGSEIIEQLYIVIDSLLCQLEYGIFKRTTYLCSMNSWSQWQHIEAGQTWWQFGRRHFKTFSSNCCILIQITLHTVQFTNQNSIFIQVWFAPNKRQHNTGPIMTLFSGVNSLFGLGELTRDFYWG